MTIAFPMRRDAASSALPRETRSVHPRRKGRTVGQFIERIGYWKAYLLAFAVTAVLCLAWFLFSGHTFVWCSDGWAQHYRAYIYYGQWLREAASALLAGNPAAIPQWDFSLGEGNDVLDTMHYYAIGSPFTLGCAFVPEQGMWIYYDLMILVRLFLSGLVFSKLCFELGHRNMVGVLAGTLSYAFCGWAMMALYRHPFFLDPMVWMPMLVLGIEKVLNGKRPWTFVWAVFLSCISNVYFAWILALLTLTYLAVRLPLLRERTRREKWYSLAVFVGCAILGIAMSAVIMLPMAMFVTGDSRAGGLSILGIFFQPAYYERGILTLMSSQPGAMNRTALSFGAPIMLSIVYLFTSRNQRTLKILLVIAAAFYVFPVFSQILNGLSYAAGRWTFAAGLLGAYALVANWEHLFSPDQKTVRPLVIFLVAYCILCAALIAMNPSYLSGRLSIVCQIAIGALFLYSIFRAGQMHRYSAQSLALCLVVCALAVNFAFYYAPFGSNIYSTTFKSREITENLHADMSEALSDEGGGFYRISPSANPSKAMPNNAGVTSGQSSTSYYWSFANPALTAYRENLGIPETEAFNMTGYNGSTHLLANACVRYYFCPSSMKGKAVLPYGFAYRSTEKTGTTFTKEKRMGTHSPYASKVYENRYQAPFAYTTSKQASIDSWMNLSLVGRQSCVPGTAVLDRTVRGLSESSIEDKSNALPFHVIRTRGLSFQGNAVTTTAPNAKLTLRFKGTANAETYVVLRNFDCDFTEGKYGTAPDSGNVTVTTRRNEKSLLIYRSKVDPEYSGLHDFAINTGYHNKPLKQLTITFQYPGTYTFDSLGIETLSMNGYEDTVRQINDHAAKDVTFGANTVTAEFSSDGMSLACFSIPYAKGWQAFVDGKETPVLKNLAYLAVPLDGGSHTVELRYHTPYLKAGAIISLAAFLLFALIAAAVSFSNRTLKARQPGKSRASSHGAHARS
ncbi:MAG: YfhO family protein [Eggerthellaceae bacterium]|jgi:uncharacterized membrane protein YfhO